MRRAVLFMLMIGMQQVKIWIRDCLLGKLLLRIWKARLILFLLESALMWSGIEPLRLTFLFQSSRLLMAVIL